MFFQKVIASQLQGDARLMLMDRAARQRNWIALSRMPRRSRVRALLRSRGALETLKIVNSSRVMEKGNSAADERR